MVEILCSLIWGLLCVLAGHFLLLQGTGEQLTDPYMVISPKVSVMKTTNNCRLHVWLHMAGMAEKSIKLVMEREDTPTIIVNERKGTSENRYRITTNHFLSVIKCVVQATNMNNVLFFGIILAMRLKPEYLSVTVIAVFYLSLDIFTPFWMKVLHV